MENVTWKFNGKVLYISLIGHIDSANAALCEEEILKIEKENQPENVVINCGQLKYISSAGLRILLRQRKSYPGLQVVDVSSEVYDILEMTGFTEMMDVQKAYRVVSVTGCEVIGQGANGKVYRIDRDTIVKQYFNPDSLAEIHRERELARTALIAGIPTAISYDVVKLKEGGYGSVFELLEAKSFANLLQTGEKTVDEVVDMSVDLLKLIHSTEVSPDSMPDMKQVAIRWTEYLKGHLPEEIYTKLHRMMEEVPEDHHMMHGDYHLKNIMLQNGEALLIDMDTLCYGHPIFELASMFNAYAGFSEADPEISRAFLGIEHEVALDVWNKSLKKYLGTDDEDRINEVREKAMIIGCTRLLRRGIRRNEQDNEIGKKQIENSRRHILELVPKYDTLTF